MDENFFGGFRAVAGLDLPGIVITPPFEGVLGDCYSALVAEAKNDLEWPLGQLGEKPCSVLDLCCGGGRFLIAAAAAGHKVTGVDISPDMLRNARRLLAAENSTSDHVRFLVADALTLDLNETFDYIVLGGLTITLFESADDRAVLLRAVDRHLNPGGRLLMDYSPARLAQDDETGQVKMPVKVGDCRGFYLVGWNRRHRVGRALTNAYCELVSPDGETTRHLAAFSYRLFAAAEIAADLRAAGFEVTGAPDSAVEIEGTCGVVEGSPSPNRWIAAQRASGRSRDLATAAQNSGSR